MSISGFQEKVSFYDLKWDTEFFGVKSAKTIIYEPLTPEAWSELRARFKDYQFLSIENRNSEPINAQLIGKDTSAFLADVNIQFVKKIERTIEKPNDIDIFQRLERNDQVLELADFSFSKFTEDKELADRGGRNVYHQWLGNSFEKDDKYFALSRSESGAINGFLLHSYSNNSCIIELIAVSKSEPNKGLGTRLFQAVEHSAYEKGIEEINVGTQIRNAQAINFYQKMGCKQIGCHQVYHLWNI